MVIFYNEKSQECTVAKQNLAQIPQHENCPFSICLINALCFYIISELFDVHCISSQATIINCWRNIQWYVSLEPQQHVSHLWFWGSYFWEMPKAYFWFKKETKMSTWRQSTRKSYNYKYAIFQSEDYFTLKWHFEPKM